MQSFPPTLALCILPRLPSRMPDSHSCLLIQHLHQAVSKYLRFNSNQTGASLIAHLVKNPPAMQETPVRFLGREDQLRKDRLPTPVFLGFPCDSAGQESACNAGDLGFIPGLGRCPGEGKGYPFQYSGLENSLDPQSRIQLSNFHSLY